MANIKISLQAYVVQLRMDGPSAVSQPLTCSRLWEHSHAIVYSCVPIKLYCVSIIYLCSGLVVCGRVRGEWCMGQGGEWEGEVCGA